MARHVKNEVNLKNESKRNVALGTKLFGIVRNINVKVNQSKSSLFVAAKTAKDYSVKAEVERAKAIYCTLRRILIN